MDPHEKLVEAVAHKVHMLKLSREQFGEEAPAFAIARSILALVADALGEPSEEMLKAGGDWDREDGFMPMNPSAWRDALAASPLHPQGDKT